MDQFWVFANEHWWLVFPLGFVTFGVIGSVGKSLERSAKRRHERRLELLRVKSELTSAKAAARARPAIPAAEDSGSQTAQLTRLFSAHDGLVARWLDYELDVSKLIAFPAMSDGRQPLTAAFLRAKKHADALRPASAKARLTREQLAEYRDAVTDAEVAFDVAEREARRIRDTAFTDAERKRLATAQRLLSVAVDEAATPAERQVAYRRVREELDGLISLSDDAIDELEQRVALELTDTATPAPPAPAAHPTAEPAPWPVPGRTPPRPQS